MSPCPLAGSIPHPISSIGDASNVTNTSRLVYDTLVLHCETVPEWTKDAYVQFVTEIVDASLFASPEVTENRPTTLSYASPSFLLMGAILTVIVMVIV